MALSRTFSWSSALRQIRSDRIYLRPGDRQTLQRHRGFVEIAARRASAKGNCRTLLKGNSHDRRGIMRLAIESARARREVTGETWSVCLSAALKGTWQAAKAARTAGVIREEARRLKSANMKASATKLSNISFQPQNLENSNCPTKIWQVKANEVQSDESRQIKLN